TVELDAGKHPDSSRRAPPRDDEPVLSTSKIMAPAASQTIRPEAASIRSLPADATQTGELEVDRSSKQSKLETRSLDLPGEPVSRGHRDLFETTAMRVLRSRVSR